MGLKSFEEIRRDLKNKIYYPVYLHQGDEPYYIDQLSHLIENGVLDEMEKEFNQTVLYGKDCDPMQLTPREKDKLLICQIIRSSLLKKRKK